MQTIDDQLNMQRNRLFAAYEKKVRALESLNDAENEIREARMGVATLDFTLQTIKKSETAAPAAPVADPVLSESPPA